jgi:hypothetical protein
MKTKTIKTVLRKKFDEFAKSITDENVRSLVLKNSIITGGSIASMLLREDVNDYDIYFKNRETVLAVCKYYIDEFSKKNEFHIFEVLDGTNISDDIKEKEYAFHKGITPGRIKIRVKSKGVAAEDGFDFDEQPETEISNVAGVNIDANVINITPPVNPKQDDNDVEETYQKYRPVYISANAITLSDKIQLIIRFFGDADEIHSNYDFAHCTCYWESDTGKLTLPNEALECLLTKELRYKGSKYPLASIIRAKKFVNRGFTVNAGQYLKMAMQLNDMDLRNLNVLEDQLIGVDALYFAQMLSAIPEDKKIDDCIDASYLLTMIDRFF